MFPSSLVHFLVVELRVVIAFYYSMRGIISSIATQLVLNHKAVSSYPEKFLSGDSDAVELQKCGDDGIKEAMNSLSLKFVSANGCVDFSEHHALNYFGYANYITIALTAFVVLTAFFLYMRDGGSWDFRSGQYIAFTYDLESHTLFKVAATMLLFWVFVGFVMMIILFQLNRMGGYSGYDFLTMYWMNALILVLSAAHLMKQPAILFYYGDEAFASVTFERAWLCMIFQTNDAFATLIAHAMLKDLRAYPHPPAELSKLMPKATQEQMMHLVKSDKGELKLGGLGKKLLS